MTVTGYFRKQKLNPIYPGYKEKEAFFLWTHIKEGRKLYMEKEIIQSTTPAGQRRRGWPKTNWHDNIMDWWTELKGHCLLRSVEDRRQRLFMKRSTLGSRTIEQPQQWQQHNTAEQSPSAAASLTTTYLSWMSCCRWSRRHRRSWRCGSSEGYRCRWWRLRRRSRARCKRQAASARSRRTGDLGVRCRATTWVQWSEWDRGLSLEPPVLSSLTAPTRCDVPVTITSSSKMLYTQKTILHIIYTGMHTCIV